MLFRAATFALLAWTSAPPALAAPPPLEAYGQLPAVEDLELSPRGDRLAYINVDGEQRQLVVQGLDGKNSHRLNAGRTKVRDLAWAGENHLLITTSTTAELPQFRARSEWSQVVSYNLGTRKSALLLHRTPETLNAVLGEPVVVTYRGEPTVLVRGITMVGQGRFDLYRVDLDTGRGRVHREGTVDTAEWVVGPEGDAVARTEFDSRRGEIRIVVRNGSAWRSLRPSEDEEAAGVPLGVGRTPGTLLIMKRAGDGFGLYELTTGGSGELGAPIGLPGKTLESVLYDPITGRLMAASYLDETREYQFFDPKLAASWAKVRKPFKDAHVTLHSWTPDFDKLIVGVEGREDPGSFYLVDLRTNRAELIADARPGVPAEAMAPVRSLAYKAADGLEIPAYLTTPAGRPAKNLPLIVLPHGGPQARDEPGFDWWAQALASRGYAVLQPQFRGSDGFGRKFVEAGYGQWGRKMQTDLSDGVRHLAREGVIDPKRVCIMGASYGGYAAMAGPALDPGVYRCAVAVAGVSDLAMMLGSEARDAGSSNRANVRYWSRFMGTSFRKRGELDAVSPARQAHKVDAPVLLIHGKDDTVVPYQQSVEMHRALQKAGKPVEFVTLAGEDHWLSRGATRLEMLKRAVAFVEKHNPPN